MRARALAVGILLCSATACVAQVQAIDPMAGDGSPRLVEPTELEPMVRPNWLESEPTLDEFGGEDLDVFTVTSPEGDVEAIFALPKGSPIPFGAVPEGSQVQRMDAPLFGLFPSPEEIAETVSTAAANMLSSTRSAVCSMGEGRPKTFSTKAILGVDFGVKGTIEMNAEWETDKMCGDF